MYRERERKKKDKYIQRKKLIHIYKKKKKLQNK